MTDLSMTVAPKSDQTNSDDLISGPRTIKVTKVSLCSEPDQPVAVHYDGDNGKPYKPCKSMRRVLIHVWGSDGAKYAGRSMTIYRDDKVQFGGMAVGGIRISHMSHIDAPVTLALTATRANRKPFTVKPLVIQDEAPAQKTEEAAEKWANEQAVAIRAMTDEDAFTSWIAKNGKTLSALKTKAPGVYEILNDIVTATRTKLMGVEG